MYEGLKNPVLQPLLFVQQAEAGPTMLTPVLYFMYFLMLLISYVNISIGLEHNAKARKIQYFLGIKPWLFVQQAEALTGGPNHAYTCFVLCVLFNATY